MNTANRLSGEFIRLRISLSEGFYGHALDPLLFQGSVGGVGCGFGDLIHCVHPLGNFTEGCVGSVQMRACFVHDEELTSGRVGMHCAGHGKNTFRVP